MRRSPCNGQSRMVTRNESTHTASANKGKCIVPCAAHTQSYGIQKL